MEPVLIGRGGWVLIGVRVSERLRRLMEGKSCSVVERD